jgi:hypothetical protein
MLKKQFITAVFFLFSYECHPVSYRKTYGSDSYGNNSVVITLAGIGALGTAVYWMKRETNESIILRSKRLISEGYELVEQVETYFYSQGKIAQECACRLLENKLLVMADKINPLYGTVSSRYRSYVAFWNWTDKMKEVFQDFNKLSKKINENLYAFSLKKAFEFVQQYQQPIFYKTESFADDTALNQFLIQAKILNKEFFEINKKGKLIKSELSARASSLDFVDKKTALDLDEIINQIDFMQTVLKYSEYILLVDNSEILMKNVRKKSGAESAYPIKDFVTKLKHDIKNLKRANNMYEFYVGKGIELLENVLEEIVCTKEYSRELQMYELYIEEQRKARAAEAHAKAAQAQAHAAHEQAHAEHRQADALREQNRIQKERNRIERERNDIERNKN